MSTLRAQQRAVARQAIVDACAALVNANRHLDFTMKEVADRAGLSLRTLYNYFPTREELLDALGQDLNRRMADRGGPDADTIDSVDDVLAAVRANATLFEQMGGLSEAIAQMPLADIGRDADRTHRTAEIVRHLQQSMPEAPEREAHAIGVLLRHLFSHRSWFWLTREYGLTTSEYAELSAWAITTLTAAARAGDLPALPDPADLPARHHPRTKETT